MAITITTSPAMQHRLINGKACNVEQQERISNTLTERHAMLNNKNGYLILSKTTSSYHPSHIIGNIFIRLQAEKEMQAFQGAQDSRQEATVSKLATSLPAYGNTIIPKMLTEKHIRSWQAHLERISDFLLAGEGIWWLKKESGDIEFLDGEMAVSHHPKGPLLHHFRSSNFSAEEEYLKKCWQECLVNGVALPLNVIRIEDELGQMKLVRQLPKDSTPNEESALQDDKEPSTKCPEEEMSQSEIVEFHIHPLDDSVVSPSEVNDNIETSSDETANIPAVTPSTILLENTHENAAAMAEGKSTIIKTLI